MISDMPALAVRLLRWLCWSCLVSVCFYCSLAVAQAPAVSPELVSVNTRFVQNQFGDTCTREGAPPLLTGDLDNDGVEDAVIIAHCKNPLSDETEHDFIVTDPFNTFFGYGNPKVTSTFASEDPARQGMVLLVIHGAGTEGWRSTSPKAKFVIINLPFKQISLKKMMLKKKVITGIYAEETGGSQLNSVVFWDGKKYKYRPMGSSLE